MPASLYTMGVGPRLGDGSREITLNQEGKPFFSVRHREVHSAFLANFPEPRQDVPNRATKRASAAAPRTGTKASAGTATDKLDTAGHSDKAVPQAVLDALLPSAPARSSGEADVVCDTPGSDQRDGEYLCVFHMEELCDSRGHYEAGYPQTLCSAYRARDGTVTELALHNVSPSRMIPGVGGVFVSGTLNRVDSPADLPPLLNVGGATLYPAIDLWWMASPLAFKPVYVSASLARQFAERPALALATPARQRAMSTSADGTPASATSAHSNAAGDAARDSVPVLPDSTGEVNAVYLDTELIGHFSGPARQCYAVARTGGQEVRLARTLCVPALDIVYWEWLPQRCELLGLGEVETSALTLVAPESVEASVQILFITAPTQDRTWVVRSPDLLSQSGTLEVLLMLPVSLPPVVLPAVRPQTPPPVLLCNSPRDGVVSVMDLPALLRFDVGRGRVTAEQMASLLLYSSELDDMVDADAAASTERPDNLTEAAATSPCSVRGEAGRTSSPCFQSPAPASPRASARRPSTSTVPSGSRLESASLVCRTRLVFATRGEAVARAAQPSNASPTSLMGDGGPQWRRCEVSCTCSAMVPCTSGNAETLLVCVLDALEAALGAEAATDVEYAYLRARWQRRREPLDALEPVAALLTDTLLGLCARHLSGAADSVQPTVPTTTAPTASPPSMQEIVCALRDPLSLTASRVRQLSSLLDAAAAPSQPVSVQVSGTTPTATTTTAAIWSRAMCELALLTLHQVAEACTLQERFWPLVPPLEVLAHALAHRLGRDGYTMHYELRRPQRSASSSLSSSVGLTALPSASSEEEAAFHALCRQRYVLLDASHATDAAAAESALTGLLSTPPLLRGALTAILRSGGASTVRADGTTTTTTCWPLLRGLPLAHPLSVANRVYCLLVTCFSQWPAPMRAAPPEHPLCDPSDEEDAAVGPTLTVQSTTREGWQRDWWYTLCEWLPRLHLDAAHVRAQLALGVGFPIAQALTCAKESPAQDWHEAMHAVVGRLDCIRDPNLLHALTDHSRSLIRLSEARAMAQPSRGTLVDDDGVSLRTDFQKTWTDARLDIPQVIFNTAAPITLPGQVEGSDELFSALTTLSRSAMALPTGRGMLTMHTQNFRSRDSIPVPALNLNGVTTDGIQVMNNTEDVAADHLLWPLLHNGCAAGFRFLPLRSAARAPPRGREVGGETPDKDSAVTRQWVVYQTRGVSPPPARAGMLLAAGILGHLRVLQLTDIYALLASPQPSYMWREATATAVMLGLGCSFRGTGSDLIFRCLSMHVRSLTPTSEDIDVSLDVQTAALLSIGLLCQQMPSNTFLIEMFLQEMSRLPSDEHCMKREGYALAAGMALGLLLLGIGDSHAAPHIEERLFRFMDGARREPPPSANQAMSTLNELGHDRDHFLTRTLLAQSAAAASSTSTCTKVWEGAHYNLGITAPAAVMALGLIYLQTDNALVSARLAPPDRLVALQGVSPLLCLVRSTMAPLVCWSAMEPTRQWLYAHVPHRLVSLGTHGHAAIPLASQQVNYLLLNLGHCIAGSAMALGLRYAGSMDADARLTILSELQGFAAGCIGTTGVSMTTFQKSTGAFERCIATCAVAVSLVMAGGGDLKVLAELRKLHSRNPAHAEVYGTNMALASAMGLLFLGSGRLTVSNSRASVAALLIALYPSWPTGPEDNVRHLQAFRHLYALAVVPRLMETMDAVTGRPVSVPIRLVLRRGRIQTKNGIGGGGGLPADQHVLWTPVPRGKEDQEVCLHTPCLLPPPETVESVEIRSAAHYPLVITNQHAHTLTDQGLVVRVLEKSDSCEPQLVSGVRGGRPGDAEGVVEERVLDWLHQLIHHRAAFSVSHALIILDELALLLSTYLVLVRRPTASESAAAAAVAPQGSHGRTRSGGGGLHRHAELAVPTVATTSLVEPQRLLRHDFLLSVRDALEARYGFLFFRGPSGSCAGHPLHGLLIARLSAETVLDQVAAQPSGTRGFPCRFTSASHGPQRVDSPLEETAQVACLATMADARQWMAEALCFFRVTANLQRMRELLARECAALAKPSTRRLALLKINQALSLPMHNLEAIVQCCYDL